MKSQIIKIISAVGYIAGAWFFLIYLLLTFPFHLRRAKKIMKELETNRKDRIRKAWIKDHELN